MEREREREIHIIELISLLLKMSPAPCSLSCRLVTLAAHIEQNGVHHNDTCTRGATVQLARRSQVIMHNQLYK